MRAFTWLDRAGEQVGEEQRPMASSAWARVYQALRPVVADAHYHVGMVLDRVEHEGDRVTAVFADGRRETGDLLIAADGSLSTVRQQYLPEVAPQYAGYVAWRGVIPEASLAPETLAALEGNITFSFHERNMSLTMLVPGTRDEIRAGHRQSYFIWYRPTESADEMRDLFTDASGQYHGTSIPPPLIRPDLVAGIKQTASEIFAPQLAAVVQQTETPMLQAISDFASPELVFGRAVLLGDAAFVARPHVANGIGKAALDAVQLVDALAETGNDIGQALAIYEAARLEFGNAIVEHARRLGSFVEGKAAPGKEQFLDPAFIMESYGAPHLMHDPQPAAAAD